MTVVLVAVYMSVLTSTLAVRKITLPVNSIQELADSSMDILLVRYIAIHGILASATGGPLKIIHDRVDSRNTFSNNIEALQNTVLTNPGTIGFIHSDSISQLEGTMAALKLAKCEFSLIDTIIGTRETLIVSKNSPYLDGINQV